MERMELPAAGYYSPQELSTRLFQLDLQVVNLAAMVKRLYIEVNADHKHIAEIDALMADMQAQIRSCASQHEVRRDIEGAPV
jgi:hypothetical protein